ncbi:MAG: enoyl-CoA hydratase/isomerase family protein [Novosphingobium sp.]|nr:MAG: enoyl-CoA hydratase/isomerase family protein [Novosphingobium sp.]
MAEVELTWAGAVATIALTRATKRNAVTIAMQHALLAALGQVAGNAKARALVVTGQGGDFCVGGDRAIIARLGDDTAFRAETAGLHNRLFRRLFALDIPLIAAVEGAALGFGAELAAACDVVLMGETARLGDPHVRFGLPPAPVVLLVWPQLASRLAVAELVMTGRDVPATEAVALGLASRMVAVGTALAEAQALAASIAALPAHGVTQARRAMRLEIADLDGFYLEAP